MFRLVNFDEGTPLCRYLSSIASKVIYNALDMWGGMLPEVYMENFVWLYEDEEVDVFFAGISNYIPENIVSPEVKLIAETMDEINNDDKIGMEILHRKIRRMKEKMADPDEYYTFDLVTTQHLLI